MYNIIKYVLFVTVIFSELSSCRASFISSVIDGNLTIPWRFNFKIFAVDFYGVIFHSVDSRKNFIEIKITQGNDGGERKARLKFNHAFKIVKLKALCGCDNCRNTMLDFIISFENSLMTVKCNNQNNESLFIDGIADRNSDYIKCDLPWAVVNRSRRLFLMIGNIGPCMAKDQLIGCLDTFYYNDIRVFFQGNSTHILPSCDSLCNDNRTCNGGQCSQVGMQDFTCDCSSMVLNGRFCNNSMSMYDQSKKLSLVTVNSTNSIYIKLSWKQVLENPYCLVEVITRENKLTIHISKNELQLNSSVISYTTSDIPHFLTLNISKTRLLIKHKNNEFERKIDRFNAGITINVGFSSSYLECVAYQGPYDIYVDHSLMTIVTPFIHSTRASLDYSSTQRNYVITRELIILIAIIPTILVAIVFLIYLRIRSHKSQGVVDVVESHKLDETAGENVDTTYSYSTIDYSNQYVYPSNIKELYDYIPMGLHNSATSPLLPLPPIPPMTVEQKQ